MVEVCLGVLRGGRPACGDICLEVEEGVTCGELLSSLDHSGEGAGLSRSVAEKGEWHLVERWNGCERTLDNGESVLQSVRQCERGRYGRVWLKFDTVTSSEDKMTSSKRRRKVNYLRGPLTEKKLSRLRRDLRRAYVATSAQASSLWLKRLATGRSVIPGNHPLEPLRERLTHLRQHNLELSTEISQLNIKAGGLTSELQAARLEARELSEGVRSVEEEVRAKRRERELESGARLADLQTEAIRLRRELETRNRLNAAQNSRLLTQKELLEQKRREKASMKELQSHDDHITKVPLSHNFVATPNETSRDSPTQSECLSHTPSGSASGGGSRKRRAVFEARTRQLLESEAEEFRRQREGEKTATETIRKIDFSSTTPPTTPTTDEEVCLLPANMVEEGKKLLTVPEADTNWYRTNSDKISYREKIDRVLGGATEVRGDTGGHAHLHRVGGDFFSEVMSSLEQSVGGARSIGKRKNVSFSPEAVILSAALEGDLSALKHCVEKLGGCRQTSHKGATCLHNAVCSSHMPSLQYLVEMGCDINAQDDDGWTPLHCAVAYSNTEAVAYLLANGASLWLETADQGEIAVGLGERELAAQGEERDEDGQEAALHCLTLLLKAQRDMGVANGGVVYVLFSREAADVDELSVGEGERLVTMWKGDKGWWEVQNERGERGLVPMTFLGSTPRYQVTL